MPVRLGSNSLYALRLTCRWQAMRLLLLLITASYTVSHVAGDEKGRVFPIAAENFAIDNFKSVNPSIVRKNC